MAEAGNRPSADGILDGIAIKTILTLRYDVSIKETLLPKLTWEHFQQRNLNQDEAPLDHIERLLVENIQEGISNQSKVAFSLSGGIDSTLIFAILRRHFPDVEVQAISIRFSDSPDETPRAAQLARQFNVDHHIVDVENYLQELPAAISIIRRPFWDLHWYHVVKKAKSLASTLLSGDGGDELFGGYTFRYSKFLSLIKDDTSVSSKVKAYLSCHERDWVPDQEKVFGDRCKFTWREIYDILKPYFDNPLDSLAQVYLADFNGKLLHNWLPLNRAFHSYFGIKAVAPLLAPRLIDYAIRLPYSLKYDPVKNEGKQVLRQLLKRCLNANNNRTEDGYTISLVKQGFSVDTLNLWKKYGHRICDYYLSDARIVREARWINESWIKEHIDKVEEYSDHRYVNKFVGLLALEIWYRLFVTKEIRSNGSLY